LVAAAACRRTLFTRAAAAAALVIALALVTDEAAADEPRAAFAFWDPQPADTDGDGAADGFINRYALNTTADELNITVEITVFRNASAVATLQSNHTLRSDANPVYWLSGPWYNQAWNATVGGNYSFATALRAGNGTLLDELPLHDNLTLVTPGEGVIAFTLEVVDPDRLVPTFDLYGLGTTWANVTNTGNAPCHIEIAPAGDLIISPYRLTATLAPGENRSLAFDLLAHPYHPAGNRTVVVRAQARDTFGEAVTANRTVNVTASVVAYAHPVVSASTTQRDFCHGENVTFVFDIHNRGNALDTVNVSLTNRAALEAAGFAVTAPQRSLALVPSHSGRYEVTLTPPADANANATDAPLNLTLIVQATTGLTGRDDNGTTAITLHFAACTVPPTGDDDDDDEATPGFAAGTAALGLAAVVLTRRQRLPR